MPAGSDGLAPAGGAIRPRMRTRVVGARLAAIVHAETQSVAAHISRNLDRLILWSPVLIAFGAATYLEVPWEPPPIVTILAPISLILIGILVLFLRFGRGTLALQIAPIAGILFAVGYGAAALQTAMVNGPMLTRETGAVPVTGRVLATEPRDGAYRVQLSVTSLGDVAPDRRPHAIRVTLPKGEAAPPVGAYVRLTAVLRPPPGPVAPGAFDPRRRAYFERIGGVGFGVGRVVVIADRPQAGLLAHARAWREDLRASVNTAILSALPASTAGIVMALLTGDRGEIDEADAEALRISGLAHILAISGLHIGIVAGLAFSVTRIALALAPTLTARIATKKLAAFAALVVAFVYLQLSGATVPTLRAFLMTAVVLLAVLTDRRAISMRTVAVGASCVLILRPDSLFGPSFQMSFAAVIALVAVYERLDRRWQTSRHGWRDSLPGRMVMFITMTALTSVVASAATAPFSAFHFHRIANYGLVANLIAVPAMASWIMPSGFAALLAMPVGLEDVPLTVMGWGVDAVLAVANLISTWPGASIEIGRFPGVALALLALAGLWLVLWRGRGLRRVGLALASSAGLIAVLSPPEIILATADHGLIAVRNGSLVAIWGDGRRGSFLRDRWAERLATDPAALIDPMDRIRADPTDLASLGLRCDPMGCVWIGRGHRIAFPRVAEALFDDCARSTMVIAPRLDLSRCNGPQTLLGAADFKRYGPHAIAIDAAGSARIARTYPPAEQRRPWHPPLPSHRP